MSKNSVEFSLDRMLTPSELDKSLQELEQSDWREQTYDSHLVTTVNRLWRVPLRQFSVEDLRIMIGQSIGLPVSGFRSHFSMCAKTRSPKETFIQATC